MTREYDFLAGYSCEVIGGGLGFVIGGVLGHVRAKKGTEGRADALATRGKGGGRWQ